MELTNTPCSELRSLSRELSDYLSNKSKNKNKHNLNFMISYYKKIKEELEKRKNNPKLKINSKDFENPNNKNLLKGSKENSINYDFKFPDFIQDKEIERIKASQKDDIELLAKKRKSSFKDEDFEFISCKATLF